MKTKSYLWVFFIVSIVGITGAAYLFRTRISSLAFDLTGEENTSSQILGVGQLALNLTHSPLDLRPGVAIEHTGVNPFGINVFLQQEVEPAKRDETLRLISEAGFHWIRQEFPWEDIEIAGRGDFIDRRNNPEGVDAWEKYDNIVDLAEKYDLEIIARLSSPPAWSRAKTVEEIGSFAPPDNFDDFANFAATVAQRYRGRVTYFQIWNEPNIYPEWGEQNVDPEAYADLLCRTYHAIKEVAPEAVILSGALAPTGELSGRDLNDYIFLQRMYNAGVSECFDILSMQGYGLWSGPTDHRMRPLVVNYARNEFIRDMMVRNGDEHKPIWISEMNWNAAPEDVEPRYGRVTLEQQTQWAPLAYQRAQEEWPWIGVISFWYFKRADDTWLNERRPEAYFQMSEPNFTLLPVYDSMKAYAHQTPVMYSGIHDADHWAVNYGEGWLIEHGTARLTGSETTAAGFTFNGTTLEVHINTPHSLFTYSVDGKQPAVVERDTSNVIWNGQSGNHQVKIQAAGDTLITGYVVRNNSPLLFIISLAGVIILVSLTCVIIQRRL